MKLYYARGACSLAIRITINELNLDCDFESVDLKEKKTQTGADYYKINPKGSVPALKLKSGEVLTENVVIQQYLAEQHQAEQLLPPIGHFERYRILEWLCYLASDLHKGVGVHFNPKITSEMKENIFNPAIEKHLNFIDQHLAKQSYLAGDSFTLPDPYLFVILRWLRGFNCDIERFKNISRYFNELKQRKSIQKSLQQENLSD